MTNLFFKFSFFTQKDISLLLSKYKDLIYHIYIIDIFQINQDFYLFVLGSLRRVIPKNFWKKSKNDIFKAIRVAIFFFSYWFSFPRMDIRVAITVKITQQTAWLAYLLVVYNQHTTWVRAWVSSARCKQDLIMYSERQRWVAFPWRRNYGTE